MVNADTSLRDMSIYVTSVIRQGLYDHINLMKLLA